MSTLNDQQEKAVLTTEGPVLVIAGAGAGKTKVITHRILGLIKNGAAPHSILAITFTNKAAKEMRERINTLLTEDSTLNIPISMTERPFVSTFHALGVHIIRENAAKLGLSRHFTIFDRSDSLRTIKEAMKEASIDPKTVDPGLILNRISRAKGDGMGLLEYKDRAKGYTEDMVAELWEKYDAALRKEKALDFDDLLLRSMQLIAKDSAVRAHYASVWKHIHVDEYQDTNKVQYMIVKLLAQTTRNIFVVGDADQNIYSWRGATIENILNFEKDYPEAATITLEKNYRSTKNILAAANGVIEKNRMRRKKTLYTDNDAGEKISLMISYTETEEANAIAEQSRALIDSGISPREIAILYRTNFQSRALEDACIRKHIPYQLLGVRFFERKEVKDILSYVQAAMNPDSTSHLARIINIPARGIGKTTVAKILAGEESSLPEGMRVKISQFRTLLADMKKEIEETKPSEALKFIIRESGIERMLRDGDADDEERLLNIQELVSVASQYDAMPLLKTVLETRTQSSPDGVMGDRAGIESFLENAALASDQDDLTTNEDAIKLMTVHASKGLEFSHVFIAGMEQDLFPFKHAGEENLSDSQEEEERRLFYVAITRAKKKVHVSYAMTRTVFGAQRVNLPSEFIDDIEKDLIENAVPERPTGAKAIFIDF